MAASSIQDLQDELDLYQALQASCSSAADSPDLQRIAQEYRDKVKVLTQQLGELQQAQRQQNSNLLRPPENGSAAHSLPTGGMSSINLPNRKRSRADVDDETSPSDTHPSKSRRSSADGSGSLRTLDSGEDPEEAELAWLGAEMNKHKARAFEFERRRRQEEADAELARKLQQEIDDEEPSVSSQPAAKPFAQYNQATFRPNGSFSAPAVRPLEEPPTKPAFTRRQSTPVSVASDDENDSDDDNGLTIIDPNDFHRRFPAAASAPSRVLPSSFGQSQASSSRTSYTSLPGTSVYGGFPNLPGFPGSASQAIQAGFRAATGVLSRIGVPGSTPNVPYDVDQSYQFPHSRKSWMDTSAFESPQDSADTEKQLQDLLNNIRPDEEISPEEATIDSELAGMLKITLMPHQRKGLIWMKKAETGVNKGGILADDMGLGKTIQAISLMLSRPPSSDKKLPTLVICTVALMDQWRREIKKLIRHRHELTVLILHGAKSHTEWEKIKHYDVILTSYGTLGSELSRKNKWDEKLKLNPDAKKMKADHTPILDDKAAFHRVFLDEAQNIKNRNTKTAAAACRINATYRWCLTGTPMQNGPDEMYSLIKFCRIAPYNSYEKWAKDIVRPLKARSDYGAQSAMRKLQAVLKAILLRRTKKSTIDGQPILQLPEKHVIEERAIFNKDQLDFYKALEMQSQIQFNRYLKNGQIGQNYSKALVLLLRLRQCCCSPQLVMNSADFVLGSGVEGLDLVQNARELPDVVVRRLEECDLECPVCFDVVESPIIFNPCGHTLCHECFSKMVDSVHAENANDVRCPHCRASIDTKKITDLTSFKEVYMDGPSAPSADAVVSDGESDDSDISDTESEDDSDGSDDGLDLRDFIVNDDESVKADDDDDEEEFDIDDLDPVRPPRKSRSVKDGEDPFEGFEPVTKGRLRSIKKEGLDDSASELSSVKSGKMKNKKKRSKGKGRGKSKDKRKKFMSLADLRKEGLKSRAAKKKYLKQLAKIYEPCTKIDKTLELLQSIHDNDPEEKVIVFSSFTSFLDLIEVPLHQHPQLQHYTRYDGSMTAKDRNDAILRFTDNPGCKIILVSLKAGNAGLNLTVANHVILLDPFWNPFVEYQAADRCHRIGQQREVYVHRVVIGEDGVNHDEHPEHIFTVEDRILQLQEKKRKLVESALDENAASSVSRLGTRELGFLFGVNQLPNASGA